MQNIQGLSIIIPSLNEEDNLIKLIDHIKNIHLEKYEIIVVESGGKIQGELGLQKINKNINNTSSKVTKETNNNS